MSDAILPDPKNTSGDQVESSEDTKRGLLEILYDQGDIVEIDGAPCFVCKKDGSYITMAAEGISEGMRFLEDFQITKHLHGRTGKVCNVGFSPRDQKWYGWSHRAIFGFGIGSKVSKGDLAYRPDGPDSFVSGLLKFYKSNEFKNLSDGTIEIKKDGFYYKHTFPEKYGKGEWIAETLEDAKQMAYDFAEAVS